jgi:hypothetical protein
VYDPKKPEIKLFDRIIVICPKISDDRAVEIQHISDRELDMGYRRGNAADGIIGFTERAFSKPAPDSTEQRIQKTDQYQPSEKRMKK